MPSTWAWRINRIKRLSEFGTSLDSASATGTNRDPLVIQFLPQAVPAGTHAFDGRYSNVENRLASPPDGLWSRIGCGRDTRDESCRSVALRRGAKAVRRNTLDFAYLEDPKIRLPLVESIQRIVIRAEIFGQTVPTNGAMEHPAQCHSINDAAVAPKPMMRRVNWSIKHIAFAVRPSRCVPALSWLPGQPRPILTRLINSGFEPRALCAAF
jgi:hypothetical protein